MKDNRVKRVMDMVHKVIEDELKNEETRLEFLEKLEYEIGLEIEEGHG